MSNDIRGKVKTKLRSSRGESISETLVAVLISALALVMLAGAIATASRLVTSSRTKLGRYYDSNNAMVTMEHPNGYVDITISDGTKSVLLSSVPYAHNTVFASNPVVAYKLAQQ